MKKFNITTTKGRKKSRSIARSGIQNRIMYLKEKQSERDLKKKKREKKS